MTDYLAIEAYLTELVKVANPLLPNWVVTELKLLLENREYGVAHELLCAHLHEHGISITQHFYNVAEKAAQEMKLDAGSWKFIEDLILQ